MERLETRVGNKVVVAHCDPRLRPQTQGLLNYLRKTFDADADKLRDGFKLGYGWSMLSLSERNGEYVLREPDFGANPFATWRDDLSTSLVVCAQQLDVLRLAKVKDGVPASFQDKIVLAAGVLDERRIFLHRTEDPSSGDSGWYIGPVADSGEQPTYESIFVFQLLRLRPALLRALILPRTWLVVFDGDEIEAWSAAN